MRRRAGTNCACPPGCLPTLPAAPNACWASWKYNELPQRTRKPNDRGIFTNGRRVQPVGACYDMRKGALRNGKCVRQCENASDITTHKNPESIGM